MASIIPGYEYDIFISYRHNDNLDGWVSDFIRDLENELKAKIKEPISIYFDSNPHDGLLETHSISKSLDAKLKCLIFIPVISQTYCDIKSFAWQNEFCAFNKLAREDGIGMDIKLRNGNVTTRILPLRIHDLHYEDIALLEDELKGVLRAIDFIYREPGVNRPLKPSDNKNDNQSKTEYKNQINKVANAIDESIRGLRSGGISGPGSPAAISHVSQKVKETFRQKLVSRNVVRASLVYVLTSLVLWKIMSISSDLFSFPKSIIQLITLIFIVLFPFAVIMAWIYERSPKGFIRTDSVSSLENPFANVKKKPFTSLGFISMLLVTLLALFLLFPMATRNSSTKSISSIEKSIAVVPFENLSNDPENEYFSKGVVEAIERYLSGIGELRVIALPSADIIKNKSVSIYELSKEHSVSNLLEGSIQRFENTIHIEVRLIDVSTKNHLWAEKYDRELKDIFKTQSEIAEEVALVLHTKLSPEDKAILNMKMTDNSKAYDLYLRGIYELNTYTRTGNNKAIDYFNQAIELDPKFARAYFGIADANMSKASIYGIEMNTLDAMSLARPYLIKALELDPELSEAHALKGFYLLYNDWDFKGAELEYRKAIEKDNSIALCVYSDFLNFVNRYDESLIIAQRLNQTDPFYPNSRMILPLYYLGKYNEAIEFGKSRLNLFKNYYTLESYGFLMLNIGHYDDAIESFEQVLKLEGQRYPRVLGWMGAAFARNGKPDEARQLIEELEERGKITHAGSVDFFIAVIYAALGNNDSAMHWLQEAYKYHEMEIPWLKSEPQFYSLHDDPEFQEILKKVGFP